jgi:hypothetical protein
VIAEGVVVQARPITSGPRPHHDYIGPCRGRACRQYKLRQNSKVTLTLPAPAVAKQAQAS